MAIVKIAGGDVVVERRNLGSDFLSKFVLNILRLAECVDCPDHCCGGRFMACQKEGHELLTFGVLATYV